MTLVPPPPMEALIERAKHHKQVAEEDGDNVMPILLVAHEPQAGQTQVGIVGLAVDKEEWGKLFAQLATNFSPIKWVVFISDVRYGKVAAHPDTIGELNDYPEGWHENPNVVDAMSIALASPDDFQLAMVPYGRGDQGELLWRDPEIHPWVEGGGRLHDALVGMVRE